MVMLVSIPEFSTMCEGALDAFESMNACKGVVFESLVCNESVWSNHDSRDEEGVEVAADFEGCRACEEEEKVPEEETEEDTSTQSRQGLDTLDTISLSSSINPAIIRRSDHHKQRRHIKLDSFTTFLPFDEEDIFRSRRTSQGSDSQCFRLAGRLHRCSAFSQDSTSDAGSRIHPLKQDSPQRGLDPEEVRMVHWDELVESSVVDANILD
ncbi:MAG: hypothetical protein SGILL_000431 [Bacillariaceae sp.]